MDFAKLPIGFAMALAQNSAAMQRFGIMTEQERSSVLNLAHNARSEEEMIRIVSSIASGPMT